MGFGVGLGGVGWGGVGWGGVGWGGVGWGGVGWGGVGWGGVKLITSNATLSHAHSHPPSLNISNILDGGSCASTQANSTFSLL